MKNVFASFLESLGIKHTKPYSSKYFNEHPNKNNLFGISQMLTDYKIDNAGAHVDKEDLKQISVPFIAHVSEDFVVVSKVDDDYVYYKWGDKDVRINIPTFKKNWSGVILLAEPSEESVEPNYKQNRNERLFRLAQIWGTLLIICALIGWLFYHQWSFNIGSIGLFLINAAGIVVCTLLVSKQVNRKSLYADKICNLFLKHGHCNDILESDAAKFMGVIGWSEVGLSYFTSNILLITFTPHLLPYLTLINISALPYTIWSVWYQAKVAKQWCVLCLMVQILLWMVFAVNLIAGFIQLPTFSLPSVLMVFALFTLPFLIINLTVPILASSKKSENIGQELAGLKAEEKVFLAMLEKQPFYSVSKNNSQILWGNEEAPLLVTILTNPHCEPCSKMHRRIEALLNDMHERICVQYVFSSFNKSLESSSAFLAAAYMDSKTGMEEKKAIFNDWFKEGKYKKDSFMEKHKVTIDRKEVEKEIALHTQWKESNALSTTPTILVNGYKLPSSYKIEDLKYFAELTINPPLATVNAAAQ